MSDRTASSSWSRPEALAVACAALMFALTLGIRQSQALFIGPLNTATGLGLASISLAFGIGQLAWGFAQPLAGAAAARWGTTPVLVIGALMVAAGTALTPYADSLMSLVLLIGVLGAGGAGVAGPSILMAAVNRVVPLERRGIASGLVNAGGSFGQFTVVPLAQLLMGTAGWASALLMLGAAATLVVPLALMLRAGAGDGAATAAPEADVRIRDAVRDRNFHLVFAGFFVCGFHVAFIATHLPGVVAACGLPPSVGAWSLALIGLFNMAGSLGIGWAVGRWRSKSLLSLLYASRAVAVLAFLAAPKTELTFVLFSAVIGLTYLSTVPPTAGLVAKFYGPRNMATLFGVVMMSHQVGGFLGAWLGGKAFEATGSYDWMWYADIALALAAALVHLPIREAAVLRARPA
ncbi:MAG TPA: MFS transporter [Quisquiliibacterium sp.]|nr:MFS transporter [Quisquiliibacterium sp.]